MVWAWLRERASPRAASSWSSRVVGRGTAPPPDRFASPALGNLAVTCSSFLPQGPGVRSRAIQRRLQRLVDRGKMIMVLGEDARRGRRASSGRRRSPDHRSGAVLSSPRPPAAGARHCPVQSFLGRRRGRRARHRRFACGGLLGGGSLRRGPSSRQKPSAGDLLRRAAAAAAPARPRPHEPWARRSSRSRPRRHRLGRTRAGGEPGRPLRRPGSEHLPVGPARVRISSASLVTRSLVSFGDLLEAGLGE